MSTILEFADLKAMLDLENNAITDYPDLSIIADSVHAALESFCGRSLNFVEKVKESGIFSDDTYYLDLVTLPISSIASFTINGEDFTDYTIDNYGLKLASKQTGAFKVTVKGGFAEIPEDIYRAELAQTVYEYQNKLNLGETSYGNSGGTTRTLGYVLLPDVKRLITSYTHPKKSGF